MMKILFWRDDVKNLVDYDDYSETINKLVNGEYAALHLEKLRVNSVSPIYSIRHNLETRILFTTFDHQICILEVILNHDYHKSRFLRNRNCLRSYLDRLDLGAPIATEEITEHEQELLPRRKNASEEIITKNFDFQEHFIELSDKQEESLKARFPFVLHGPAGSGKTMLAVMILQNLVRMNRESQKTPIYVTKSANLKKHIELIWNELHMDAPVKFLTYQEFLAQELKINARQILPEEHFNKWYQISKIKEFPAKELHQEFRIISGYSENFDSYLALGRSQSLFPKEDREVLFNLFKRYQKVISPMISEEFSCFNIKSSELVHVVIDEAQDFSFAQLNSIFNYSGPHTAILMGDHQVLFDGISRHPYIKQFFFDKGIRDLNIISLPVTYRCPQHVNMLTNQLIQLKYDVTGGMLDKLEISNIAIDREKDGRVEWLQADEKILSEMKERRYSTPCAIIDFESPDINHFNHSLHFHPFSIKGLEFDTVILWNPFKESGPIARCLSEDMEEKTAAHRPKKGEGNPEHLNYLNEVITAVTRSKIRLVIVHDKTIRNNRLIEKVKSVCLEVGEFIEESKLNPEAWIEQARILLKKGQEELACKIFLNHLHKSSEEFNAFKAEVLPPVKTIPAFAMGQAILPSASAARPRKTYERHQKRRMTPKDHAQQLIEFSFSVDLLMDIFENYKTDHISSLLKFELNNKPIMACIGETEEGIQNFIKAISHHKDIFNGIYSHIDVILKARSKVSNCCLNPIFGFIKLQKDQKLLQKNSNSTLLHLVCYKHEHNLLRFCLSLGVDANIRANDIKPFLFSLNSYANEENSLITFQILKEYHASFSSGKNLDAELNIWFQLIDQKKLNLLEFLLEEVKESNIFTSRLEHLVKRCLEHKHMDVLKRVIKSLGIEKISQFIFQQDFIYNCIFKMPPIVIIHQLIELGFDLQREFDYKNIRSNLLMLAVEQNQIPFLDALITILDLKINEEDLRGMFYLAIERNYIDLVHYMLEKGMANNNLRFAPLASWAAKHQHIEILKLLAEHHISLDITDEKGISPITWAIGYENYAMFCELYQRDVDLHALDYIGNNLATLATIKNNIEMLKDLLNRNVNHQIKNKLCMTPLLLALEHGNESFIPITKLLIEAGVDISYRNKNGLSISDNLRIYKRSAHLFSSTRKEFLQEQYYHFYALENDLKNTDEAYPLHSAIINGEIERASSLLEQVTDINELDAFRMTPLMLACRSGANTIALKLIEMNAHLDCICPSTGKTAIFWAVEHHQIDVMKALVDKGANLSIIEKSGKTLNMLAAMNDNVVFLRYFNDPNTINHQDNHGRTALHYACLYKCSHYISSLLDLGANPKLCDHHGNNLLHFFDQIQHSDKYGLIPRLMNDFGLNCNAQNKSLESAWMRAMKYLVTGNFEQFTKNNSVDFRLRDGMGNSFSHYYASSADERYREELIPLINLHDLNDQGQTPAYFAFINRKFETFESITSEVVRNGGWHYVKDKQNKSLLHWAAQLGALHYMQHFLQMNGVDINEEDDDGNTAVYFAIKHKQVACLDYLIYHRTNIKISDLELALKLGNDQIISLLEPYRNHLIQNIQNTRGLFFDSFESAACTKAAATNTPK